MNAGTTRLGKGKIRVALLEAMHHGTRDSALTESKKRSLDLAEMNIHARPPLPRNRSGTEGKTAAESEIKARKIYLRRGLMAFRNRKAARRGGEHRSKLSLECARAPFPSFRENSTRGGTVDANREGFRRKGDR